MRIVMMYDDNGIPVGSRGIVKKVLPVKQDGGLVIRVQFDSGTTVDVKQVATIDELIYNRIND